MEREKLKKACRDGDVEQVQTLLENKSRKLRKECRDEALVEATRQGHIPIIALLLGKGARMNELSFSAMVEQKKPEIFQEFLKHGWDINSTRFQDPALRCVSQTGVPNSRHSNHRKDLSSVISTVRNGSSNMERIQTLDQPITATGLHPLPPLHVVL